MLEESILERAERGRCAPVLPGEISAHRGEGQAVQPPRIEIIPARPAVCGDAPTSLEVLVRITPPLPEIHILRPPINLGLVLDRSGSMSSDRKMEHAREAAIF